MDDAPEPAAIEDDPGADASSLLSLDMSFWRLGGWLRDDRWHIALGLLALPALVVLGSGYGRPDGSWLEVLGASEGLLGFLIMGLYLWPEDRLGR